MSLETNKPTAAEVPTELPTAADSSTKEDYFNSANLDELSTPEDASTATSNSLSNAPSSCTALASNPNQNSINAETAAGDEGNNILNDAKGEKLTEPMFGCNICLDTATDAVVSMCGHLFCWPCLHQWLETRPKRKLCPVCKASVGRDQVIPLYSYCSDSSQQQQQQDPRDKIPPRPVGQRIEAADITAFQFGNFLCSVAQYMDVHLLSKYIIFMGLLFAALLYMNCRIDWFLLHNACDNNE